MNLRFWTWGRKKRAKLAAYRSVKEQCDRAVLIPTDDWFPVAIPRCYCEHCKSEEPHVMLYDAIRGESKKCVRCFTVSPVQSEAEKLFSDDNLRPDIGFDEARIKLENATRVYNEWAVKYALFRESGECVNVRCDLPTCGDNSYLFIHLLTISEKRFEGGPTYTD